VNLNVEQMVSMVFEMRGQLQHEVERRKALESQLYEARAAIEQWRDAKERDNNKWGNLLSRVKELEVASKLDTRMMDLQGRAERVTRQQEQGKIVGVFQNVQARLDAQEREYRDSMARLARDAQRDQSRTDSELRHYLDAQLGKVEQRAASSVDGLQRVGQRVQELEKDFAVFMNTQMQMQMNAASKEKDGDWLKIYLTENFNAQKAQTDVRFAEQAALIDKLQNAQGRMAAQLSGEMNTRLTDAFDSVSEERAARESAVRKLHKSLKLSFTNLADTMQAGVASLDAKLEASKRASNDAVSNLHALVLDEQRKLAALQSAFDDSVSTQREQSSAQHSLATRLDGLEEVLKAEIKARIKNNQKSKLQASSLQHALETRLSALSADRNASKQASVTLETRSVLDGIVAQVEEAHYVELRKNEWKAFGQVIELELQARDEEMERRFAAMATEPPAPESIRGQVTELRTFISNAFAEFETHERESKAQEEEQAQLMHMAMETRAVLDSMVTHVADAQENAALAHLYAHVRKLDAKSASSDDQIAALKHLLQAGQEDYTGQLTQAHGDIMKMAAELAAQVDSHTAHLQDITQVQLEQASHVESVRAAQGKLQQHADELSHVKAAVQDLIDVHDARSKEVAAQKAAEAELKENSAQLSKEVKSLKKTLYDVQDHLSEHQRALQNMQGGRMPPRLDNGALGGSAGTGGAGLASGGSGGASSDELHAVSKRLDGMDRRCGTLESSSESLLARQAKLDKSILAMQALQDEQALALDRRLKDLANKLDTAQEESETSLKRAEKKIRTLTEDIEQLGQDLARGGGAASPTKARGNSGAFGSDTLEAEEAAVKLRAKVAALSGVVERVETLRAELKDVQSRLDGAVSAERHARDLKELQQALHDVEALQGKDVRLLRDSIHGVEDLEQQHHKNVLERVGELEDKVARAGVMALSGGEEGASGSGGAKRGGVSGVDASYVDKEISSVQSQLDSLSRRVKESSNAAEDSVNRVAQDVKKVGLKVETLESMVSMAPKAAGAAAGAQAGDAAATSGSLSALSGKVDALESELKLKSLPALTLQLDTLSTKMEARTRELDTRVSGHDSRLDRLESDAKQNAAALDELDSKAAKRARDLTATIEAQSARDLESQSALKAEVARSALEQTQVIAATETRLRGEIKQVAANFDALEVAQKAHVRAVDEKLGEMAWSLEYAKDAGFKADVKQIRAGAEAPPPQQFVHMTPQQSASAGRAAAAPASAQPQYAHGRNASEQYEPDSDHQQQHQQNGHEDAGEGQHSGKSTQRSGEPASSRNN